jgi:hypothetical protein
MLYEIESSNKPTSGVLEYIAKGQDKDKESQPNEGATSWLWHFLGKNS